MTAGDRETVASVVEDLVKFAAMQVTINNAILEHLLAVERRMAAQEQRIGVLEADAIVRGHRS